MAPGTKTTQTKPEKDEDNNSFTRTENLHQPATEVGGKEYDLRPETQMELKRQAGRPTSVDGQGITRLVSTHSDNWVPSALEPDPDEVERLKATTEALEAARKERAEMLGLRTGGGSADPDEVNAKLREQAGVDKGENVDKSKER